MQGILEPTVSAKTGEILTIVVEPCPYCGVVLKGRNLSRIRALRCPSCGKLFTYSTPEASGEEQTQPVETLRPKRRRPGSSWRFRRHASSLSAAIFSALVLAASVAGFWLSQG